MTASRAQTVEPCGRPNPARSAITEAQRLIGNVVLGHEDGVLYCDSAWRYDNGQVDVFSNIRLNQPPSTVLTADFLQLTQSDWASASGQVQLQHEEAARSPAAYQLASRQARYSAGPAFRRMAGTSPARPVRTSPKSNCCSSWRRRGDARTGHLRSDSTGCAEQRRPVPWRDGMVRCRHCIHLPAWRPDDGRGTHRRLAGRDVACSRGRRHHRRRQLAIG